MGETLDILKETWRRFWPNPYIWLWPTGGWIGSFILSFVLLIFFVLGPIGVLLGLFGSLAYGSLVFSGLIGSCAAAASTEHGRADWADVAGATRRFLWPVMGLLAIVLGGYLLLSMLAMVGITPLMAGPILAMEQAASPEALGGLLTTMFLWMGLVVLALAVVAALLFGFAPAAMGLDGVPAIPGIGRGFGFVRTRFGLAVGIIGAGVVMCIIVPALLSWPLVAGMMDAMLSMAASGALSATEPSPGDLGALAGLAGYMGGAMAVYILLTLYSLLALPFFMLATFVAYHRNPMSVSVTARPLGATGRPADAAGRSPNATL